MAIGTPNQLATQTAQTSGQTSHQLVLGSGIAANSLVVVATYANAGYPTNVAAGGNTYTLVSQNQRGSDKYTSLFYFFYASAPGAQTVTITIPSSNMTFARAWEISGIDTTSQLDEVIAGQGLSTTQATGNTPSATDTADEIVMVSLSLPDSSVTTLTWPPTTSYTTLGEQNNATRNARAAYAYKIVNATGVQSATSTTNNSQAYAFPLGTFRGAAGGGGGGDVFLPELTMAPHIPTGGGGRGPR